MRHMQQRFTFTSLNEHSSQRALLPVCLIKTYYCWRSRYLTRFFRRRARYNTLRFSRRFKFRYYKVTRYSFKKRRHKATVYWIKFTGTYNNYKSIRKLNQSFWLFYVIKLHSSIGPYLKRKFVGLKYFFLTEKLSLLRGRLLLIAGEFEHEYSYSGYVYKKFFNYLYLYSLLMLNINKKALHFAKKRKRKVHRMYYHLILTFKNSKLFINLNDNGKRNYFFVSSGFFIKFFERKKFYKKSKIVRSLMTKYLRKIFLLIRIPRTVLIIKNKPVNLIELLKVFNTEIPHKFYDPESNKEVIDTGLRLTKFIYFIFSKNNSYVKNKERKRGRIKRKIFRKLVKQNSITD